MREKAQRVIVAVAACAAACATPQEAFDVDAGADAFWGSCTDEGGRSREGPLVLAGPPDVEALTGVAVIDGDLTITGPEITTLAFLSDLRCVRGRLAVEDTTALRTLEGLEGLVAIEEDLELHRNLALESVEALSSLRFLGPFRTSADADLSIVGNPRLAELTGLSSVPELRGDLVVRSNAALTSLAGLEGIGAVWGDVTLFGNAALETTVGLDALVVVNGRLEIRENAALSGVAFRRLAVVDEDEARAGSLLRGIRIEQNPLLFNVGLPALTRAVTVIIGDNPELRGADLGALQELRARMTGEGDLLVSGPELTDVDLGGLVRVDDEMFVSGERLEALAAPRLVEVRGDLRVGSPVIPRARRAAPVSLDLTALATVGGDLHLDQTAIADVDGLAALERIGGRLEIVNNPALTELRGLALLSSLGRTLTVRNNVVLPTCEAEALAAQLAAAGYSGIVSISANDDAGTCP